jgi:hypothetical protein
VVDSAPQVVPLAVDLHENLVEMTLPMAGLHPFDLSPADLIREKRAKPMPPILDRLVAHIDTSLVKQFFDIPQRERKTHIQHHCQANDLGARLEVLERGSVWSFVDATRRPAPSQAKLL